MFFFYFILNNHFLLEKTNPVACHSDVHWEVVNICVIYIIILFNINDQSEDQIDKSQDDNCNLVSVMADLMHDSTEELPGGFFQLFILLQLVISPESPLQELLTYIQLLNVLSAVFNQSMRSAHACMCMCLHVHSVWQCGIQGWCQASSSICHFPLDFEVQSLIEPGAQQFNWSSTTVPSRVSYFYLLRVGITASHWLFYVCWRPRIWSFCSVVSTHSLNCPPALYPASFTNHLKMRVSAAVKVCTEGNIWRCSLTALIIWG